MTLEEAQANFRYDPDTGEFIRLGAFSYRKVGATHRDGRIKVKLYGKHYWLHRVAWLLHYKKEPEGIIDHIDGNPSNNRISNLRIVDEMTSQKNRPIQVNSPTACLGVAWLERYGKWRAQICVAKKNYFLGHHATIFDAAAARKAAEIMYGFHKNHSRAIHRQAQRKGDSNDT